MQETGNNEILGKKFGTLIFGSGKKIIASFKDFRSIVDAVGEKRTQNQPGTSNEYPNWRIPLADGDGNVVPLEQLFDNTRLREIAAIMRG